MPAKSEKKNWYAIDNAGVLYSALQSDTYSPIYRFSAVMDHPVDRPALQRAIDRAMPRFPTFNVRMKKGLFWHYLEHDDSPGPFLQEDVRNFCQPIDMGGDNARLVRFFAYENRISIECFHALSDGGGAIFFFKTLLAEYLRQRGEEVPCEDGVLDLDAPPDPEEKEDAYRRYAKGTVARGGWMKKAYHPGGEREPYYTLNVTQGILSVSALKEKAKSHGASITEYLSAVLIWTLLQRQEQEHPARKREVALAIPINLRAVFPSKTLRNFILTARPVIDPNLGDYTFDEVVQQVHHQLRLQTSKPLLRGKITGNVNFQKNPFLKVVPCVLKDPVMELSYRLVGVRPYSTTYTNPGVFRVPPQLARHIRRMEVVLGQPYAPTVNCASISFEDTMAISFAGSIHPRDVEGNFFRFLVKEGLHVKVLSNRPDPSPCTDCVDNK